MNCTAGHFLELQVLQGLEAARGCVDDMDEWLRIFNTKLRHMREDIASVHFFFLYLSRFCIELCLYGGLFNIFCLCRLSFLLQLIAHHILFFFGHFELVSFKD